jgi:iron complex transport system permease protein
MTSTDVGAQRGRERRRSRSVTAGLVVAVVALMVLSLSYGEFQVSAPDILRSILHQPTPPQVDYIIRELRLPRTLTGTMVGIAFGLSGSIFQQLIRNPLASPDVLGITAGSSASAVLAITVLGISGLPLSLVALLGALASGTIIYVLSWRKGLGGYRMVLVGIGVAAVLAAIISFLLTRTDIRVAGEALLWLNGSLSNRTWEQVVPLAWALLVLVPLALILSRALLGLQLGDDLARGLGLPVERSRVALLFLAVCLAGAGTAAAGPVAFVAFVSGPIAARMIGGGRPVILAAGLFGAALVLAADFVGQHLLGPNAFPVGVVTAVIGAPYLLYLLATANRSGTGG